ncbi:hypothetical protein AAFF_G00244640 [Aldrovandia affinis]|uniref:Uncharacterized protein n=1 Tax=Aldrovandia affinis TaxID=143900 RepID=A0AAD7W3G3_9TELE|nr:hypothetical protein AAFF_G00244640 [Aldrovandia affinis]
MINHPACGVRTAHAFWREPEDLHAARHTAPALPSLNRGVTEPFTARDRGRQVQFRRFGSFWVIWGTVGNRRRGAAEDEHKRPVELQISNRIPQEGEQIARAGHTAMPPCQ